MSKKHIITIGYQDYAVDSTTAAMKAMDALSKLQPVKWVYKEDDSRGSHYTPEDREHRRANVEMKMNQTFLEPRKAKPEKVLALPAPKRGSILCICEKSYVAPRQSCVHCGRAFTESHNRTHQDKSTGPNLRLI